MPGRLWIGVRAPFIPSNRPTESPDCYQSLVGAGVVDHVAEPGTSALDRAYALAREMQACGESKRM